MNPRLQQALDGDIEWDALSPREQDAVLRAESAIGEVLGAIPMDPAPDLAPAILSRITARPQLARSDVIPLSSRGPVAGQRVRRLTSWLWRPHGVTIGWRPAYALAAAAVLVAVIASPAVRSGPVPAPHASQVFTQFVLRAPDAKSVSLAGDFTAWQPAYVMTRAEPGVWTVVVPLDPGIHSYSFVVDGERWVPDPMAPAVDDGFGGVNSRVAVLTPDERKG